MNMMHGMYDIEINSELSNQVTQTMTGNQVTIYTTTKNN
jgi:hypothetical protein